VDEAIQAIDELKKEMRVVWEPRVEGRLWSDDARPRPGPLLETG
jgi:hypothetical protein